MERYYKPCNEHGKKAKYCLEEKRWICSDCEPELMGTLKEVNGVKLQWGEKNKNGK